MITHTLQQGSDSWHAYRQQMCNASDAPAMLGLSSYKTRDQLIAERATGTIPEVDAATQRRFDEGHRFEALARPLAENIIGQELYPVTGSLEGTNLSASFDGLTLLEDIGFEHKRMNQRLQAALSVPGCTGADLPLEYQIQMEQQCLVSGCEKILFMASNWDGDALIEALYCWYTPNLELRAKIVAGWEQFHQDVAAWKPPVTATSIVGQSREALPALLIHVTGAVTASNLDEFKHQAMAAIASVNTQLESDQDFANAELDVKWCSDAEARISAAKQHALAQTASIDALFRAMDEIAESVRAKRLLLEKSVKTRKEEIKASITLEGVAALRAHIASLNARLGQNLMPTIHADFAGAIKGKRTLASLRDAVNTTLAHAKIEASAAADRIEMNVRSLGEWAHLFPDLASVANKPAEDFANLLAARIAQHQKAEADRQAAAAVKAQPVAQSIQAPPVENVWSKPLPWEEGATNVVPLQRSNPTLKLGQIGDRLGFSLTADFLKGLGFAPAATERASKLYHEADFPLILAALVRHIEAIQVKAAA